MVRHLIRLACLVAGAAVGWFVFINLSTLLSGWGPLTASIGVALSVFAILYFPLFRHLADAADDRLSVVFHRGRHVRVGSGLSELPLPHKPIICAACGGPGGPLCPDCERQLSEPPRK